MRLVSRSATRAAAAALCLAACGGDAVDLPPPVTVAASGASNPTVALGPDGGAFVAWVGNDDGVSNVYIARADSAGGFGTPVRVNDIPGDASPHAQAPAQVAVGPDGSVYVVWQNRIEVEGRRFPASDLRFARSTDGGRSFEPAIYVNDDAGGEPTSHTFHDMVVAPDGTIYASWIDGRAREGEVGQRAHGGQGGTELGPQIRVATSTDGGRGFGPSTVVDDGACPCCRTALALGPAGEVYVAWRKVFDGGERDIAVARSDDGGATFDPPVRVHRDAWAIDACPHAGPALAVDAAGRVHVAWYTGADGRAGLHYAVSEDGGASFGSPTPLSEAPVTAQVKADANSTGRVWIAWEDRSGDASRIRLAVAHDGELEILDAPPGEGVLPEIAARNGPVIAAWAEAGTLRAAVLTGP